MIYITILINQRNYIRGLKRLNVQKTQKLKGNYIRGQKISFQKEEECVALKLTVAELLNIGGKSLGISNKGYEEGMLERKQELSTSEDDKA